MAYQSPQDLRESTGRILFLRRQRHGWTEEWVEKSSNSSYFEAILNRRRFLSLFGHPSDPDPHVLSDTDPPNLMTILHGELQPVPTQDNLMSHGLQIPVSNSLPTPPLGCQPSTPNSESTKPTDHLTPKHWLLLHTFLCH